MSGPSASIIYINRMLWDSIKSAHIIFIVTWFAGMFYLVRLQIYTCEAQEKNDVEKKIITGQLLIMQKRLLFGITLPSAILTLICGISLLFFYSEIPSWLFLKLILVILLFAYFFSMMIIYYQQHKGVFQYTSKQLRLWNEVATIFLTSIVFLVVTKSILNTLIALAITIGIIVIIFGVIHLIRKLQ